VISLSTSIWQDFFGVSNETAFRTIVPALIAIVIFILGILSKWFSDWNKNRQDSKQKREFVLSQVKVLIKSVIEQRKWIEDYIKLLGKDRVVNREFQIDLSFQSKHISNLKADELFKILVLDFFTQKKQRLMYYNSLLKQLDLIDALRFQFNSSLNYSKEHFSKYEDKWNDNIEIVGDLYDEWINYFRRNHFDIKTDNFIYALRDIYIRWAHIPDYTDMYVAGPNLIDGVLNKARENSENQYAIKILRPLLRCKDAVDNHRNLRKFIINEFERYLIQLNDVEKILKDFLSFYNYEVNNSTQKND